MWKVVLYINTVSFEAPIECTHSRMKQDRIGDDESCSGENKKNEQESKNTSTRSCTLLRHYCALIMTLHSHQDFPSPSPSSSSSSSSPSSSSS